MTSKKEYKILALQGDGIGPEIMREALKVLSAFSSPILNFAIQQELIGGCSIDAYGDSLQDKVKHAALEADAILFGCVGGPKWDNKRRGLDGPEGGLLRLRHALDVYGNIRPCLMPNLELAKKYSPLKPELLDGVDFVVVRENCGGAYFGNKVEDKEYAMDEWGYSTDEIKRITRVAAHLALRSNPPRPIISCDKANVLASSRLWRRVVTETLITEFPTLKFSHQLADSAAMIMMVNPKSMNGVILSDNTFGDILSDVAAAIPGSLGVLPSASINGIPTPGGVKTGVYEPTHGSAPSIAGKNIANPIAMILSVSMMFRYSFDLEKEAQIIDDAVKRTLDKGIFTGDIGGTSSTSEVGDAILKEVLSALKN